MKNHYCDCFWLPGSWLGEQQKKFVAASPTICISHHAHQFAHDDDDGGDADKEDDDDVDDLYHRQLQQFASLIMLTNFPTIMMTVNILSLISSSAMLITVRQVLITEYKVYMLVVSWANEVYRYGYSGTTMVCRHL